MCWVAVINYLQLFIQRDSSTASKLIQNPPLRPSLSPCPSSRATCCQWACLSSLWTLPHMDTTQLECLRPSSMTAWWVHLKRCSGGRRGRKNSNLSLVWGLRRCLWLIHVVSSSQIPPSSPVRLNTSSMGPFVPQVSLSVSRLHLAALKSCVNSLYVSMHLL